MNAIIFDLDDTLHRERRWALGGLAAVASHVERQWQIGRRDVFRVLGGALRSGRRGHALQDMCRHFGISEESIPAFVAIIRSHEPRLRLGRETRGILASLRKTWRLGVLTNGRPDVQARKVAALGLAAMVDTVVYADLYGGKPTYLPFLMVADRLGAEPSQCVFVGNDPWCDVYGARRVGMRTVQILRDSRRGTPLVGPRPNAVITRMAHVPAVASRVVQGELDDVVDDL